jgi:beta-lactamase class D
MIASQGAFCSAIAHGECNHASTMRTLIALAALLTIRCATASTPIASTPAGECFMLQALDGGKPYVSNREECALATAPASTFKIPHALIALETGVVTDAQAMVAYDGSEQPFETWKRAHSLDSAMKWSVYPFFIRTATAIGRERMLAELGRLRYGTDTFERELTTFWNNGDLAVTPAEQLDLLRRMFRYELPASRANVDAVKASLLMPEGSITNAAGTHPFAIAWPKGTIVRAKTGNTRHGDGRVSWLVGHLESNGKEWVFVARKRGEGLNTTAGAELARRMLDSARERAGAERGGR